MISSMLLVAWILFVTACSCFWNARRAATSLCAADAWLRTALITASLLLLGIHISVRTPDLPRLFAPFDVSGRPFGGLLQTALEQPDTEPPLGKEKSRRCATPAALTVGDVVARAIEHREH